MTSLVLSPADETRRRGLRRMRTLALSAAAARGRGLPADACTATGSWGFVNAGAEASMVGAIADWFAVTALFRHPLGLPVPHTALIPKRKDELGPQPARSSSGRTSSRRRSSATGSPRPTCSLRVGSWLADAGHTHAGWSTRSRRSRPAGAGQGARRARRGPGDRGAASRGFREEPTRPLAGGLLEEMVRDESHHGLVDLALDELHGWLVGEPARRSPRCWRQRAPWWAPPRLNDAVTRRVHLEAGGLARRHPRRPPAPARGGAGLDARQLGRRPAGRPRDPGARPSASRSGCSTTRRSCDVGHRAVERAAPRAAAVPGRRGRRAAPPRLGAELRSFGERLRDDDELRARLDGHAADVAVFVVETLRRRARPP